MVQGFDVDPRVASSREFNLNDEDYVTYLVLCSIPGVSLSNTWALWHSRAIAAAGIAFSVIVLLVFLISGCTKCLRQLCCSSNSAEGEEGVKLPKAYFDTATGAPWWITCLVRRA